MRRAGLRQAGRLNLGFGWGTAAGKPARSWRRRQLGGGPLPPAPKPGLTSESLSDSISTLSSARAAGVELAKLGSSSRLRGLCSMLHRLSGAGRGEAAADPKERGGQRAQRTGQRSCANREARGWSAEVWHDARRPGQAGGGALGSALWQ